MPYVYKTVTTAGAIFCYKHYSARYGKRSNRALNMCPTKEQQKAVNKRISNQRRLWTICDTFRKDDYFVTLTYRRDERPDDMDSAMKLIGRTLAKVSRKLKQSDIKLTYMHMAERGTKGAIHHHILIKNRFDIGLFAKMWTVGSVNIQQIYTSNMLKLGMYMIKGDSESSEKRYSQSRDIAAPKPVTEIIKAEKWLEKPRPKKGYDIINIVEGTDAEFAFPYQEYIMVKRE